jgi:hypothetical protein
LDAQWHPAIWRALETVPAASRQTLLDELAGQMAAPGKLIHNPPGWLLALARRFVQGTAVLALADKVRADRQSREQHQLAYERALQAPIGVTQLATEAQPSSDDVDRTHQHVARLRAVRRGLKAGQP